MTDAMSPFVIVVTGSRTWRDQPRLWEALDLAFAEAAAVAKSQGDDWQVVFRHGKNPRGADAMAAAWVAIRRRIWHEHVAEDPRPADWPGPCRDTCTPGHRRPRRRADGTYCPAAGDYRNEDMLTPDVRAVLAFLDLCAVAKCRRPRPHYSHGASHCAETAERSGIPVRKITP